MAVPIALFHWPVGQSRNPEISSIISEAEKIAEKGVKEIVMTGVNIGDFGKSTGESFASSS